MTDPRDKYTPKHPTPPLGSTPSPRAPTSPGMPVPYNPQPISNPRHLVPYTSDTPTPVDMPLPGQIERTAGYAREARTTTIDIQRRVGELETKSTATLVDLGKLATQVVSLDTKVDLLVEESKESRRERQERERAAQAHDAAELAFRRERAMKIITIVVPTLTAIGAIVAGILGAYK